MSQTVTNADSRRRRIAWLLLGLPIVVYAVFWPVRSRLDRGVIERHIAGDVWRTMADSLPTIGPQVVLEALFWFGCLAFLSGSLALVWLALAGTGGAASPQLLEHQSRHAETELSL